MFQRPDETYWSTPCWRWSPSVDQLRPDSLLSQTTCSLCSAAGSQCERDRLSTVTNSLLSQRRPRRLDWIVQCFTSPPTQYRLYERRFLQVKTPNQQYQKSTEGDATKEKNKERKQLNHTYRHTIIDTKQESPAIADKPARRKNDEKNSSISKL